MKGKIVTQWTGSEANTHKDHIIFLKKGDTFDIKVVDHNGVSRDFDPVGTVNTTVQELNSKVTALEGKVGDTNKTDLEAAKSKNTEQDQKIQTLEGKVTALEAGIGVWG